VDSVESQVAVRVFKLILKFNEKFLNDQPNRIVGSESFCTVQSFRGGRFGVRFDFRFRFRFGQLLLQSRFEILVVFVSPRIASAAVRTFRTRLDQKKNA
jgi:hypothetical protein